MAKMSLLDVGELLKPIGDIIDSLHTSKEEKARLNIAFYDAQVQAAAKFANIQRSIIEREMSGESPAQRNWRPHLMYVIIFILAWNFIISPLLTWISGVAIVLVGADTALLDVVKAPALELPDKLWTVLLFALTGYVGLRSLFDKGGLERMFKAKNGNA
ncbi:MAG: 3TM-type holin [Candidatus Dojkabacteria bacterium]|nr:3TM-type holin [Candidatus Dojkabacteria bacterium]